MNQCKCGCGGETKKQFISGHNLKNLKKTKAHCVKIGLAQKRAWETKRERKPIGSKNFDTHGYIRVKVVRGSGRWEKEHKLVMEQKIGRKLLPGESVHHINFDKTDNRIENLFLVSSMTQHKNLEATLHKIIKTLIEKDLIRFDAVKECYELMAPARN